MIRLFYRCRKRSPRPALPPCAKGPHGKPYFAPDSFFSGLYFNISNSGSYEVLAVSDEPVGIDLQRDAGLHYDPLKMAQRWFTPEEVQLLSACESPAAQQSCFFRLWTAKEAYIKLTGEGLSRPLDSFRADLGSGSILIPENGQEKTAAAILSPVFPEKGYYAAVCTDSVLPAAPVWEPWTSSLWDQFSSSDAVTAM